ncbi:HipA N-terminal domain-containing protein [Bifidobacterium callitrichos]
MRHREVLHVWNGGRHVGEFSRRRTDSDVDFRYDSDESTSGGVGVPISLSLPVSGVSSRRAPKAFLENMLPADPSARRRIRLSLLLVDSSSRLCMI